MDGPVKARWSWRVWQSLVKQHVTDADALALAEVWPAYSRKKHNRVFWAHEMTYDTLKGWSMSRVMQAANVLEKAGLASRCPGTPMYAPEIPEPTPRADVLTVADAMQEQYKGDLDYLEGR